MTECKAAFSDFNCSLFLNEFYRDVDFEYPNAIQGQGFADLFTALRSAFDQLAAKKGDSTPYQISVAVSAGAANYANLVIPQMNSALTFWSLMVQFPYSSYHLL